MTQDELAAHPSYPELLAADGHNLLGRLAALEQDVDGLAANDKLFADLLKQTAAAMLESAQAIRTALVEVNQRVNDLQAQLAQHEAAPYPHVRYTIRDLGVIVADGLDAALADYDIDAQTDGPDAFERLSAADSVGGA